MSSIQQRLAQVGAVAFLLPALASVGCGSSAKTEPAARKAQAAVTSTGQLPASTGISVSIDVPPDGALIASPPGSVNLQGTATVGAGAAAPGTIVFAIDASQATGTASDGVCDPGTTGTSTILGCEIAAALKTNSQADPAKVTQVGVVIFGGGGQASDVTSAVADMGSATGDQPFAAPGADVATVLSSITAQNVGQFTPRTIVGLAPSFAVGLQASGTLAGAGPGKTVVFLSNGANAAGPAVADATFPADVVVRAFSLGDHDCAADASGFGSLGAVAARGASGSTCQRLASLSDLPDVTVAESTRLTSLSVTVDGGAPTDISAGSTPALPQDGPASVQYAYSVQGLAPGLHKLCVQAGGADSGGNGSVEACIDVKVASIAIAPTSNVSELGTPGQTHTVVATVAAGAAGGVPGVQVSFNVTSGPNVGGTATVTTDANGQASFTYTARQHCAGLGTDVITACFTDAQGTNACASATQTWQDTVPPVPSASPGPNPGGNVPGSAGNGGQNPSGFYRLTAVDAVDEDPQVFLKDAGSGMVFGPFHSGVNVKYTQAPGAAPGQKAMAGVVPWHITGKGDAQVYAKDCAGNVSAPVWALVPPKPK